MRHRLIALALLAVTAAGCGQPPGDEPEPAIADEALSVTVAIARIETLRDDVIVTGSVVPSVGADWTIFAPEAGQVVELPQNVGDDVVVGDLLVRFDILSIAEEVSSKQALLSLATQRVAEARLEADRLEGLFDQGLIARNELEASRAALADARFAETQAQGDVDMVQVLEDTTRVTARFDGIVQAQWKTVGDFVDGSEHDPVLRVVDPTRTQVAINVPEERAARIQPGMAAALTLATGETLTGTVRRVEPSSDPLADGAEVRLAYERAAPLELATEVRVELVLDQRTDVVVIPVEALLRDQGGPYVMTAGADMVAHRRPVRVGLTTDTLAQITQGLDAGERIIAGGAADVIDGQAIRVGR